MILTLCYMYATLVQWWRLGALRQRLAGTLGEQNALLLCASVACIGRADAGGRALENLLYQQEGRIACTVVPRQRLSLAQWAAFPKDRKCFPLHYRCAPSARGAAATSGRVHLLLQASLATDAPTSSRIDFVRMEKFGELVAWRALEHFEVVLRSDLRRLAILMNSHRFHAIGINHELPLIKVETVSVEGAPGRIKYERRPTRLALARGPTHVQVQEFALRLRQLYAKLSAHVNPKITIESGNAAGKLEQERKHVSEVKPVKKAAKNTLDVHHSASGHKKKAKGERAHRDGRDLKDAEDEAMTTTAGSSEAATKTKERSSEEPVESAQCESRETNGESGAIGDEATLWDIPKDEAAEENPKAVPRAKAKAGRRKSGEKSPEKRKGEAKVKEKPTSDDKIVAKNKGAREADKSAKVRDRTAREKDKGAREREKSKLFKYNCKEKRNNATEPVSSAAASGGRETLSPRCGKSYSEAAAAPGRNLQRQDATSRSKEPSPNRGAKPPNILVYADTALARENVKAALKAVVSADRYTVYDFPPNAGERFWDASTTLVVVCGQVPAALTPHLLGYLVRGGQLLCLCSDLLYSVLQPFSTAEVREHELVRFTYGEWRRVRMMHHIFCYQASPARKQFSREASDQSMNGSGGGGSAGSSPVAPRTPSIVDIQHAGQRHTIQVQVLGAEETWQTPSLLLAAVKGGAGKAVFSQVHLEVDPAQYQDDERTFAALMESNQARLEIMRHILAAHLGIDCDAHGPGDVEYGPAYFLGRHDLKMAFIRAANLSDGKLRLPDLEAEFVATSVEPPAADARKLPVMVLRCPTNFSTVEYFDTLRTERVGRLVIYADVMASSQRLLAAKLADGLVVIARRQTAGKGRSGNDWLSPEGCAMFSLQLHIPLDSHLGRSLPLAQHLVMVAVARAVRSASGLESLEVGLKWPNDLYAYGNIKIGGLVATSIIESTMAIVSVGCGVNLDNRTPTVCVNDMIRAADSSSNGLSPEKFFASTFNEVEALIDATQAQGIEYLLDLYYQHWLHTNANITVTTADGASKNVTIKGVDAYGFLQVQDDAGALSSVQSDGNTFDMLCGLIAPKLTSA